MASYATYNGDGSTVAFTVPFGYLDRDHVKIYVDGVLTTAYQWTTATQITFDSAPANGTANILLKRETPVDDLTVEFDDSSAWLAGDVNNANLQALYRLEELQYNIDNLETAPPASDALPSVAAADSFLVSVVSGSGYDWAVKSLAQTQSILGLGSFPAIPAAASGSRFLMTDASSAVYELNTLADTRTILGIPSGGFTIPSGQPNRWMVTNSAGNDYEIITVESARTRLGLQGAAFYPVGTSVNSVVALVAGSGATPALPAVSGENLTNVAKLSGGYAVWARDGGSSGTSTLSDTTWTNTSAGVASAYTGPTGTGITGVSAGTYGVSLPPGRYRVVAEQQFEFGGSDANARIRIKAITGTTTLPSSGLESCWLNMEADNKGFCIVEAVFTVTATADVAIEAYKDGASSVTWKQNDHPVCRFRIEKQD